MVKRNTNTNGQYKTSMLASGSSNSPDPIAEKIRQLQQYDEEDDADTDVTGNHNIVAMPGSVVTVQTTDPTPAAKKPRWLRIAIPLAGAIAAAVAKVIWDHLR